MTRDTILFLLKTKYQCPVQKFQCFVILLILVYCKPSLNHWKMVLEDNLLKCVDSNPESESSESYDDQSQSDDSDDDTDTDRSDNDISDTINEDSSNINASGSSDPHEHKEDPSKSTSSRKITRSAKIRDMLIFKEINNDRLPTELPPTCDMIFADPNELHIFKIKVSPIEGYWSGGIFFFDVFVPEEYNFEPPKVKCTTKIWHPNITEDGAVCLSILRSGAIDETGWNPARQLKDVILGINSLFTDLVNFHDPLNNEAADMYNRDPTNFQSNVNAYIREYAQNSSQ